MPIKPLKLYITRWLLQGENQPKLNSFAKQLTTDLKGCFVSSGKIEKHRRERMWGKYHRLRTSDSFRLQWSTFLQESVSAQASWPTFYQYITDVIFKELIKQQFPIKEVADKGGDCPLAFEELNALTYAAGYIPRALRNKLNKSAHPLKDQLMLCLLDLTVDADDDTHCWFDAINRGGLTSVNNMTYQVFLSMEYEIRTHLTKQAPHCFKEIADKVKNNDDVQFYWSVVSADWEEDEAHALLELVTNLWITIRGFSFASSWIKLSKRSISKSL